MVAVKTQVHTRKRSFQSAVVNFLSTTCVVLLLLVVVLWHETGKNKDLINNNTPSTAADASSFVSSSRRWLLSEQENVDTASSDTPKLDDDTTRTETCKKYLYNFLNGTTDARDECQGFYKAYKDAECEDESHGVISSSSSGSNLRHKHKTENGTIQDDDVLIDDFFENWECCDSIKVRAISSRYTHYY
jgi:hypothetical protein